MQVFRVRILLVYVLILNGKILGVWGRSRPHSYLDLATTTESTQLGDQEKSTESSGTDREKSTSEPFSITTPIINTQNEASESPSLDHYSPLELPPPGLHVLPPYPCPVQPVGFVAGGPPNCQCVQKGQCTIERIESTKILLPQTDLACGHAYEPCCYADSPYPGTVDIFAHALPCIAQEQCGRRYGQASTDVAQFGTIGPCPGAGAVRCLDHLGIPAFIPPPPPPVYIPHHEPPPPQAVFTPIPVPPQPPVIIEQHPQVHIAPPPPPPVLLESYPCPIQPEGWGFGSVAGAPNCRCVQRGQCTALRMELTKAVLPKSDIVCGHSYEACCFATPYPGFVDIFGGVLACLPQEQCVRKYGDSPTDIRDFGTLSPCPGGGAVRCLDALGIPPFVPEPHVVHYPHVQVQEPLQQIPLPPPSTSVVTYPQVTQVQLQQPSLPLVETPLDPTPPLTQITQVVAPQSTPQLVPSGPLSAPPPAYPYYGRGYNRFGPGYNGALNRYMGGGGYTYGLGPFFGHYGSGPAVGRTFGPWGGLGLKLGFNGIGWRFEVPGYEKAGGFFL